MEVITCVVVGAGYAGIHAVDEIRKTLSDRPVRMIVIDHRPHHLRKVLLFKPAVTQTDVTIPLNKIFPEGVEFVQGTVTTVNGNERIVEYKDKEGNEQVLGYDILVLAVGSEIRQAQPEQGGIALTDVKAAETVREQWLANMRQAMREKNQQERQRLLTLVVAGAGISGIEMSAEFAYAMRVEATKLGIDPNEIKVYLVNAANRLFMEGPVKMAQKLEQKLSEGGVSVLHGQKVLHEEAGTVTLSTGRTLPVGLCVWSLGLTPNPLLRKMGLPVTTKGQVEVDSSYRVIGTTGVYSIGDCARVVDATTGRQDHMTCKEATGQAARLGQIVRADLDGTPAPAHKSYIDFYCIGLGPEKGIVWTRKWGLDIILTGKLGWKLREFTWNIASMIK
ncbi:pyridine nucleotide-disulfide oxidoreductase [Brevibacillus choshinensis]|uniref:NADH:ubiquinone reductase (non-electrogenic) n=1 Tax=Brevibacillus choshinensis TaxID=54911 RepID=A0ABR5N6T6_BRECH|nr:FAD-dependent oxidoreductase [Brevibacillus choshinensis]KQL46346.1 pyridine nucleotide-disulfide oxidoreductase [Brevibacillus choshinensis]